MVKEGMQSLDSIIWSEEVWNLSDLKPYELNPRRISKSDFEKLINDIKQLGYHDRVKVNTDGTISSGHQRFKALEVLGYKEVPVLVPSRELTKKEFERVVIQGNLHRGEFDHDMLANHYDVEDLIEYGAPPEWFPVEETGENTEVSSSKFNDLKHKCPKCGFNYD